MKANTYVVKPFGISEVKVIALKGDPGTPTQEQVNTAVDEYMTEHPEAQIPDGSITEQKLSSDVVATLNDVDNKADKVGSYPDLIAGTADNLLSSSYQTDRTPYLLRRTPYGARERGSIVGGSIVWNQLCNNASVTVVNGHKYLLKKDGAYSIGASTGTALTGLTVGSDMVIDLTLMFGSTIADYIYTQEQASAGAGVALAKAWAGIVNDYYPYDTGSIKSVEGLTAHKMTGFNLFDKSAVSTGKWLSTTTGLEENASNYVVSDYIPVFAGKAVYIPATSTARRWFYDSGKNPVTYLGNAYAQVYTPPTDGYIRVTILIVGNGASSLDDICINFSDPSRNGQHEPYTVHTYPLDSTLTLRGLPKLDGDNLYYDGDIYPPSGEVEEKWAEITLNGTENWSGSSSGGEWFYTRIDTLIKVSDYSGCMLCDKLNVLPIFSPSGGEYSVSGYYDTNNNYPGQNWIYIRLGAEQNTAAKVKEWLASNPITVVYKRATPTTEQAEPYTALQICDPNGTEEWVGANMPVGHETKYYADLKGKIEDLPDAPSTNGTYVLKATVSSSGVTYAWIAG